MSESKTKLKGPRKIKQSNAEDASTRRLRIAEAAYYKAEQRGFAPGCEERDWLEAENEIEGAPHAS